MNTSYFEFEVTLLEVEPRLWRSFLLRDTGSFEELHGAIQRACGWGGVHLYEFRELAGDSIASSEQLAEAADTSEAASVPLQSYFKQSGQECQYLYDFGDNWRLWVKLIRKVALPDRFVQRLTGGEGVFPPEDCGGVSGYEGCVKACRLTNSEIKKLGPHERQEILARKEWLGGWRPVGLDFKKVQAGFRR